MAHNIFHTGTEWLSDNVIDPVKNYATDVYVDYKINDMFDSLKDEFKGPTTITPEMADAGWKYGLDGVPYNSSIAMFPEDFETDSNVTPRPGNIGPDFVANNTATTSSPFLSQDLRQRTPSGTIYNPSMEAFNNASLFNYEGPGGVPEYTYGQGLPMDYGVYGTPPGPNLYYEGQFGEGFVEPGVADTAITLPPVTMPDGVPQIPPSNNTNTNTSNSTGTGNGGNDLTYAETIAEMGIAPGDAPSTLFPGTGTEVSSTKQASMPGFNGMNPDFLVSQADQGPDIGLPNYTNNGTISAADQARFDNARMERFSPTGGPSIYDTQYTVGANNAMSPVGPSIYDTMTSPTMIGGEEQVFEGSYDMNPNDDGAFAYGGSQSNQGNFKTANQMVGGSLPNNIMRNPNEETQQYRGIYVDPRTVPEIDLVQSNQTFMPSFPADYGDGSNLVTTTSDPYDEDNLIVSKPMTPKEQAKGTNPELFEPGGIFYDPKDEEIVVKTPLGDLTQSDLDAMSQNGITIDLGQTYPSDNYSPTPKVGFDELFKYGYDFISSGNTGNANAGFVQAVSPPATTTGYAGNIQINPFTLDMSPSEIAYQDAVANPVVQPVVNPQPLPSFINEDSGNQEGKEMYEMFKKGLLADDMMIGSNYLGVDDNPKPAPVTVSIPSIFRPPAPRPTPAPTVFASPGGAPGYTSYGPPNFQLVGGR